MIQSRLHKALKGKPTTTFGEDSARSETFKSTVSDVFYFSLIYFSVLIDIFPRLISGVFYNIGDIPSLMDLQISSI